MRRVGWLALRTTRSLRLYDGLYCFDVYLNDIVQRLLIKHSMNLLINVVEKRLANEVFFRQSDLKTTDRNSHAVHYSSRSLHTTPHR